MFLVVIERHSRRWREKREGGEASPGEGKRCRKAAVMVEGWRRPAVERVAVIARWGKERCVASEHRIGQCIANTTCGSSE